MKNYVFAIWCICLITALSCSKEQQAPTVNRVESFLPFAPNYVLNYTNVYAEIMLLDIKFSEKVLRQVIVESGHFKSYNCLERNNIFGYKGGVKDSSNKEGYAIYNNWMESVAAYKRWQEKRLTDNCVDYYQFLIDNKYHEGGEDYEKKCEGVRLVIVKK
jgi:hypothetical protein